MAKLLSELDAAAVLAGTEPVWVEQSGLPVRATTQDIADLGVAGGGLTAAGTPVNDQIGIWTSAAILEGQASLTYVGGNLSATQFAGIVAASLVDKTAAETISGLWTHSDRLVTDDSTTARAGLNVPTGVAPTSPVQGDIWVTATDAFIRINGVSETLIGAGGGGGVTAVTGGVGVASTGGTTPVISLTVDELAEKTGAVVGTDRLVGATGTTNWAETISGIPLSIFNDDLGHVENVSTALSVGTVTTTTVGITSDGGADDVILPAATVAAAGMLTTAKWAEIVANTAKVTNASHTGDVTGATALTIANSAVTLAKMADIATDTFLGRVTAATGVVEALTNAQAKTALDLTGTNSGDQTITLTGDVTGSGTGSFAATIQPDTVTMDKIVDIATDTFLGRVTAATGTVEVLTNAQAKTALDLTGTNSGDQTITLTGDVTGSGTGSFATTIAVDAVDIAMLSATGVASATTFLRGDNTWNTPAGGGNVSNTGTPVNNQIAIWTSATVLEGVAGLTFDGTTLEATQIAGIVKANLVDKTAVETISGAWTYSGRIVTDDSTTARAGFNIPNGVAPTTPVQGDMWVTATDAFIRINGVSSSIIGAGGGGVTSVAAGNGLDFTTITTTGSVVLGTPGDTTASSTSAVSATSHTHALAAGAVTLAKMANVATATVFYRKTAATGVPEVQTLATLKTDLGLTGTNSGNQTTIVGITGSKAQFNTAVTDGTVLYVGDVTSNVTHTGEVAGSGVLTVGPTAISNKTLVVPVATDMILFWDATDSALKRADASNFLGGSATALSIGTVTATTFGITSDGGANDVILPEATTLVAGLLGAAKWDEIVANTLKVTNATHSGDATGATALTLQPAAITGKTALTTGLAGTDELLVSDAGVLKRMDVSVMNAYFDANLTFAAVAHTHDSITDTNLVDKSAAETISGDWTHSGQLITDDSTTTRSGFRIPEGVAPTTPVDGDMWVTAAGAFNVRLNGATVDVSAGGTTAFVTKVKTADETLNTSTTYQDDNHLTGWNLDADSYYKIEGFMEAGGNSTADMKYQWVFSNAEQTSWWRIHGVNNSGNRFGDAGTMSGEVIGAISNNALFAWECSGHFRTNVTTGGTLKLQWAQNVSNGGNVTMAEGTWFTVTKIQ